MTAKLYSLPAFKAAQSQGFDSTKSAKFARHVATEMAQDGDLVAAEAATPDQGSEHPEIKDLGGNYAYSVGPKYARRLDIAEIAKLVRWDIKDAIKKRELPQAKYAVRISRFSGGCSLDVRVSELPDGFPLLNAERVQLEISDPHTIHSTPRYTPEGTAMLKKLESIVGAYNYDRSHSQTDYFDVNFYSHVKVDWEFEAKIKKALVANMSVSVARGGTP